MAAARRIRLAGAAGLVNGPSPAGNWNKTPDTWSQPGSVNAPCFEIATSLMLDFAAVRDGTRVLDIATAAGEQTIAAARRAGARGHVHTTDLSPAMIDAPLWAADHPKPFDAAICRLGLTLMPDPAAGLRSIRACLRPGGRFAAVVHGPAAANPFIAQPLEILRRHAGQPDGGPGPDPFDLSDPADLAGLIESCGFADVIVLPVPTVWRFPTIAAGIAMLQATLGQYHVSAGDQPPEVQAAAWAEIADALHRHAGPRGLAVPGEFLVAGGINQPH